MLLFGLVIFDFTTLPTYTDHHHLPYLTFTLLGTCTYLLTGQNKE